MLPQSKCYFFFLGQLRKLWALRGDEPLYLDRQKTSDLFLYFLLQVLEETQSTLKSEVEDIARFDDLSPHLLLCSNFCGGAIKWELFRSCTRFSCFLCCNQDLFAFCSCNEPRLVCVTMVGSLRTFQTGC